MVHGIQHYKPIDFFGGEKTFNERVKKDNIKTLYCEKVGIELLRIKFNDDMLIKLNKIQ